MREYFDKENGIVWVDYFSSQNTKKNISFTDYLKNKFLRKKSESQAPTREDIPRTLDTLSVLDEWSTGEKGKGIRDYVLVSKNNNDGMGTYFFNRYIRPDRDIPPQHEDKTFHFITAFQADSKGKVTNPTPLGTVLLSHAGVNTKYRDVLEYIVVNPDIQSKGVGSKLLSSMATDFSFFTEDPESKSLATYIHNKNTASRKLFTGVGFQKFIPPQIYGMEDDTYCVHYTPYVHDDFTMAKNNIKSKQL
ncbi:MAG: GNAT family N-acetyltransferase [Clostridiales bacterium]|nr:GNAT family N-acetyltransferase [Clostridiales bacterium]